MLRIMNVSKNSTSGPPPSKIAAAMPSIAVPIAYEFISIEN